MLFQLSGFVTRLLLFSILFFSSGYLSHAQGNHPDLSFTVSMPHAASHYCHIELEVKNWIQDSIHFKMPQWVPGYYQLMNYSKSVENFSVKDVSGKSLRSKKLNDNTWSISGTGKKNFTLRYDVKAEKQFVANSYVGEDRAYLVGAGVFVYIEGRLDLPVSVKINSRQPWSTIATGLEHLPGKVDEFIAPDFDILYDCPILIGNLEELPSFTVKGVEHRFIGHNIGTFDKVKFMTNLKKVVEAASDLIGDIPYKRYTFIGIGPGRGGIEHLNNTTVSFDGNSLDTEAGMNKMMNFLAHEYFHHYNVKRIRPFELGPFDYDKGSRTNLLWVSEGLSVYYEYLIVKRAGLINKRTLYADLEQNINAHENNPGRFHQSLTQASYKTWKDGPFGTQGEDAGKSISYYDKGPVVGLLLDFAIRNTTQNKQSLDDVMRFLYWHYYKQYRRGFTDAEFEQACETIAGAPLSKVFEYVYTTKELDYSTYLGYAGLQVEKQTIVDPNGHEKTTFSLKEVDSPTPMQQLILKSWANENP